MDEVIPLRWPEHGCLSVAGSRGTGKTTAVRALLRERRVRRRLILDPLADYREGIDVERVVSSAEAFDAYIADVTPRAEFSVAWIPDQDSEADIAAALADVAWQLGDCVLVLEEAHDACNARTAPDELIRLAKRGRHANVGLWACSQRPSDVHPSIRAELAAHEAFVLRLAEARDLEVLAARRGRDFAAAVARLPNLHAFRVVPSELEPELWRIASFNPPTLERANVR